MYYTVVDPYKNYLLHHGIKGQKWGIRRFQNPDGTLTDAGRERYRKLADSYKMGESNFYYRVNDLKEVKNFRKQNKESRNRLFDAQWDYDRAVDELNAAGNKYATKKAGAPLKKIIREDSVTSKLRMTAFMDACAEFLDSDKGEELLKQVVDKKGVYIRASREYERLANNFVEKLLGDYGNTPLSGTITFDKKTNSMRENTLAEMMALEILRDAQRGRIDF